MKITREFIYAIAPSARAEYVDAMVKHQDLMGHYGIDRTDEVCYFLGQCAVETMGFNKLEESLYYTSTKRLRQVWPSRFKSDAAAAPYVRNPMKLANLVYGGRLGNTGPNDGWAYRGSGLPHLTGKANYEMVQENTGLDCVAQPEMIRSFPAALESACVFWFVNKLEQYTGDVKSLTKRWQGGNGGLKDREMYTKRALKAASVITPTEPIPEPLPEEVLLREGSRGEEVIRIQVRLEELGYELGHIDGIFGDATERAVAEFQRDHDLAPDGVVGPATREALASARVRPVDPVEPDPVEPEPEPAKPVPPAEPETPPFWKLLDAVVAWIRGLFRR